MYPQAWQYDFSPAHSIPSTQNRWKMPHVSFFKATSPAITWYLVWPEPQQEDEINPLHQHRCGKLFGLNQQACHDSCNHFQLVYPSGQQSRCVSTLTTYLECSTHSPFELTTLQSSLLEKQLRKSFLEDFIPVLVQQFWANKCSHWRQDKRRCGICQDILRNGK